MMKTSRKNITIGLCMIPYFLFLAYRLAYNSNYLYMDWEIDNIVLYFEILITILICIYLLKEKFLSKIVYSIYVIFIVTSNSLVFLSPEIYGKTYIVIIANISLIVSLYLVFFYGYNIMQFKNLIKPLYKKKDYGFKYTEQVEADVIHRHIVASKLFMAATVIIIVNTLIVSLFHSQTFNQIIWHSHIHFISHFRMLIFGQINVGIQLHNLKGVFIIIAFAITSTLVIKLIYKNIRYSNVIFMIYYIIHLSFLLKIAHSLPNLKIYIIPNYSYHHFSWFDNLGVFSIYLYLIAELILFITFILLVKKKYKRYSSSTNYQINANEESTQINTRLHKKYSNL
ncbi:hypothetical protein [Carboxylicivirga sp. N1Y90]|uniref:hypothetical protein n=1 Tax=Carboxylicivirga fragile TaxID=3417571 RepID=UPI003D347029|nr:hypothetical protein [Marinilabiliaceae bacterium N1Y90]